MKRVLLLLMICIVAIHVHAQTPRLTLEHTFDGYYYPYNMDVYNPDPDNDKYFRPASLNIDGNHIEAAIYNEDYGVKERINAIIDTPEGYKIQSVSMSGDMILPDGTAFFIIDFIHKDYSQRGNANYAISKAYSLATGNPFLFDIASASSSISCLLPLYVINGKISLVVLATNTSTNTNGVTYKTHIFSLGKADAGDIMSVSSDTSQPYPSMILDMNGRLVNKETRGIPVITQYSDGSVTKTMR